jgi:hypothetical protein
MTMVLIMSSVLVEQVGVEESDWVRVSFGITSPENSMLPLEGSELEERERGEAIAAIEPVDCGGSVEDSTILKSSKGVGGVNDLGDERGLDSGLHCAAGVLRQVVL